MAIIVNLDVVLAQKKMSVTELSEKSGYYDGKYLYSKNRKSKKLSVFLPSKKSVKY